MTTLLDSFAPAAREAPIAQEVLRGLEDVDPALDHPATELDTRGRALLADLLPDLTLPT